MEKRPEVPEGCICHETTVGKAGCPVHGPHPFSLEALEEAILDFVKSVQGCKITEVCSSPEVVKHLAPGVLLPDVIENLVYRGRLVEVQYTLDTMNYRMKSFILPAGTRVFMGGVRV